MDIVNKPISTLVEVFSIFWGAIQDVTEWLFTPTGIIGPFRDNAPIELILGYGIVAVLTYILITWILNIVT